jgi:hypothetical protein
MMAPAPPPAPAMAMEARADMVVVTGMKQQAAPVITASQEDLGDLKLYRVPGRVDVSAKGMKQVAFLDRQAVKARLLYQAWCDALIPIGAEGDEPDAAGLLLVTRNEEKKGLGIALPQGALALFEPVSGGVARGDLLAARASLRDYARGQDVELDLGTSGQVFARCGLAGRGPGTAGRKWSAMRAVLTNANPHPVTLRLHLGEPTAHEVRFPRYKVELKNGWQIVELTVPANTTRTFDWQLRSALHAPAQAP